MSSIEYNDRVGNMTQLVRRTSISILTVLLFLIIVNGCAKNPEERYQKGSEYFKNKMWDKAIVEFGKALQINPSNAKFYLGRGNAYGQRGLCDQAIADYNKAIEINPNYAEAYTLRGDTYNQKERYDQAIADCNKAIGIKPSYGGAYIVRGYAYYHTEKYDKAWEDMNRAKSLGEQVPPLLYDVLEKNQKTHKTTERKVRQTPVFLDGVSTGSSGKKSAVINGKIVFEGDNISNMKIERINKDSVDILVDGQKKNIKLSQGEAKQTETGKSVQGIQLKKAISVDDLENAVKLIEAGEDVNTTDERGRTALMIAASGGEMDKEYLKLLLSNGADVNMQDQYGTTALHLAVVFGSKETVNLLLSYGAKVNVKDNSGKTPLMLAEEGGKEDIAELLRSK